MQVPCHTSAAQSDLQKNAQVHEVTHILCRNKRNQKVERMILLVLDSANNIVGKAKGLRSWVPQSGFYGHAEIADMLLNAKEVDLDVRIYLMDFYMTDLEKQLPDGREKDDILFALRPAWEQLVEENK